MMCRGSVCPQFLEGIFVRRRRTGMLLVAAATALGSTVLSTATAASSAAAQRSIETVLNGVTCVTPTWCVAAGSSLTSSGKTTPLVEATTTIGKWSMTHTPDPKVLDTELNGVSCSSRTACTAVGTTETRKQPDTPVPYAMRWNGKSWQSQTVKRPRKLDGYEAYFYGVSCPTATTCVAAGTSGDESSGQTPRSTAEVWNGNEWKLQLTPSHKHPFGGTHLHAVSCATATSCTAVGYIGNDRVTTPGGVPIAEHWNGHGLQWSFKRLPLPSGIRITSLDGIACPTTSQCVAVGTAEQNGGFDVPLIEVWDGKKWTATAGPNVSEYDGLDAISCPERSTCIAVGSSSDPVTNTTKTLIERWDGTTWSIDTSPSAGPDAKSVTDNVNGVSCPSTPTCVAVGRYFNGTAGNEPLALRLAAGTWRIERPQVPKFH
jgi:hypothetical protein